MRSSYYYHLKHAPVALVLTATVILITVFLATTVVAATASSSSATAEKNMASTTNPVMTEPWNHPLYRTRTRTTQNPFPLRVRGGANVIGGGGGIYHRSHQGNEDWFGVVVPDRMRPVLDRFVERTYYSASAIPKSIQDAEWNAFLKGWLLITLPIPLSFVIIFMIADTFLLLLSKWDKDTKNKHMIGFYHGVTVAAVLLRELEAMKSNALQSGGGGKAASKSKSWLNLWSYDPRKVLLGMNLAATLFLGQSGKSIAIKRTMDGATFATLFYILIRYFR